MEDRERQESSGSSTRAEKSKKGSQPSKGNSKDNISQQREVRKRNNEKNYDSAGSPSTNSPRPKRTLNSEDTAETRKPR